MEFKFGIIPGLITKKGKNVDYLPDAHKPEEELLKEGVFTSIKIDENEVSPEELRIIGDSIAKNILQGINKADFPKGQCVTIYEKTRIFTPDCLKEENYAIAVSEDLRSILDPFFKKRAFSEGAFLK